MSIYHLAAASCYIELIVKEADNNVKLIVLGRFDELREKHEKVLDDLVMEILRVLSRYKHACGEHCIEQALIYAMEDILNHCSYDTILRAIAPILRFAERLLVLPWIWSRAATWTRL